MNPRQCVSFFLCITMLGISVGCQGPYGSGRAKNLMIPPDFSVELLIDGDPLADDPRLRTSRYILEPNRQLRVAKGYDSVGRTYPRLLRVVETSEYDGVAEFVRANNLRFETNSGRAKAYFDEGAKYAQEKVPTLYQVLITAWGETRRYTTTPSESPKTVAFVEQLAKMAGEEIPAHKVLDRAPSTWNRYYEREAPSASRSR